MKEFIIKYYAKQPITDQDVIDFLHKYLEQIEKRPATGQQLIGILQLIKQGVFRLEEAVNYAARIEKIQVDLLTDKLGQVIYSTAHLPITEPLKEIIHEEATI